MIQLWRKAQFERVGTGARIRLLIEKRKKGGICMQPAPECAQRRLPAKHQALTKRRVTKNRIFPSWPLADSPFSQRLTAKADVAAGFGLLPRLWPPHRP